MRTFYYLLISIQITATTTFFFMSLLGAGHPYIASLLALFGTIIVLFSVSYYQRAEAEAAFNEGRKLDLIESGQLREEESEQPKV